MECAMSREGRRDCTPNAARATIQNSPFGLAEK